MAVTTFDVDEHTGKVIASLRASFGVKTNAAVIQRALALARLAAETADDDHTVLLIGKNNEAVKVNLA